MLTRSLGGALAAALAPLGCVPRAMSTDPGVVLNDVHARLNATRVARVHQPASPEAVASIVRRAGRRGQAISIAGSRHAMGGQQFGRGCQHLDMTTLDGIGPLDADRRVVEVQAGVQWPVLMDWLAERRRDETGLGLGIIQKQTGADQLSLGGAIAANIHGRGLTLPPMVNDIEAITLVDARGEIHRCSRTENVEQFRLAIGGYGLIGVVTSVSLRLMPRRKIVRRVALAGSDEVARRFDREIAAGALYGDFQFSVDAASEAFLQRGIVTTYHPVPDDTLVPRQQLTFSGQAWRELIYLAHADPAAAYERYVAHYLATDGQIYLSDEHQRSSYLDGYHALVDQHMNSREPATEMITELYVPRHALASFMAGAASLLRERTTPVIYGTVRLIDRDDETLLAWARQPWACIIFNLHCVHTRPGLAAAADSFRDLIDLAIRHEGSYYLTYHRWARPGQVEQCHPRLVDVLRLKRRYDPQERFQSQWYRHYREMFADRLT
ncbi:MAG: FAD-binding oxidoreductase [Phycisphaeraceae bacterium]